MQWTSKRSVLLKHLCLPLQILFLAQYALLFKLEKLFEFGSKAYLIIWVDRSLVLTRVDRVFVLRGGDCIAKFIGALHKTINGSSGLSPGLNFNITIPENGTHKR